MRMARFESYLQRIVLPDEIIETVAVNEDTDFLLKPAGVLVTTWSGEHVGLTMYRSAYPGDDARRDEVIRHGPLVGRAHSPRPLSNDPAPYVGWATHRALCNAACTEISAIRQEHPLPPWVTYGLRIFFYSRAWISVHVHPVDLAFEDGINWKKYLPEEKPPSIDLGKRKNRER
ncbi:hypothetical protein [Frankia sp. R82]|uniref:hypothetical protein n=1 Tax=Frankia sp. R82 TaxID=2950553 RepID=UPI00204457CD|nr:hypothetical protein [Frankia sp. R82]MCM3882144.1 hypothetical protein [Frankia sp. R82]